MRMLAAVAVLASPLVAFAGQRQQSFRVGAVVIRSTRLQLSTVSGGSARLHLKPYTSAVLVQPDGAPARLESGRDLDLPPGTSAVTVHY